MSLCWRREIPPFAKAAKDGAPGVTKGIGKRHCPPQHEWLRRAKLLQRFQILDQRRFFFSVETEFEMLVVVVHHVVQCGKPAIVIKTTMHMSE